MSLFVIGINHKTAPVAIREKVAFAPERMQEALHAVQQIAPENLILSTCNRTELYATSTVSSADHSSNQSQTAHNSIQNLIQWLSDFHHIPRAELEPYLFIHQQDDAVRHALRVACGLDSLVLGEPQILGQLKTALQQASDAKATGNRLQRLMQHAFTTAKKVRTQTSIGSNPISVAFAAVSIAKQIFSRLEDQTALLVGAGETIELVGKHLAANNIGTIIVANRNADKAQKLANEYGGTGISLPEIPAALPKADIVISSTAAPLPIIGKGIVERALKIRKHSPVFMVDIAVPRDIEPEVGELDDIYLYTVDDLQSVIEENLKSRKAAAEQAENMVQDDVSHFMAWMRAQDQMGVIRQFRQNNEAIKQEVLGKAQQMLNNKSPDEVLEFLAHTLTNKLSHAPTQALNQAARQGDEVLLANARKLLNLSNNS